MELNNKLVLESRDIMEILRISQTKFWKLCRLGIFRALPHIGNRKKYPVQQLTDFIASAPAKKENK